jgi:hypothetical protein
MRPESVGLVEGRNRDSAAEVTQVGVTVLGDSPSSSGALPRSTLQNDQDRRGSGIFSTFWLNMASWKAEKSRPAATDEYVSVSGDDVEIEDGVNGDSIRGPKHKTEIQWTWPTYFFGLLLV